MSTKAIREALEFWARECPEAPAGIAAKAGLREVEAIERAAKALSDGPPGVINDAASDAWLDLGESIAKTAPEVLAKLAKESE